MDANDRRGELLRLGRLRDDAVLAVGYELHGGVVGASDDDRRRPDGGRLDDHQSVSLAARREELAQRSPQRPLHFGGRCEAGGADRAVETQRLDEPEHLGTVGPVSEDRAAELRDPLAR